MNTVSTRGFRRRFMSAIWSSYSKSETAHHDAGADPVHEVHEEAGEALHPAGAIAAHQPADRRHPLLHREQRLLLLVVEHGHQQLVEHGTAALDDVEVAVVDRIERPG